MSELLLNEICEVCKAKVLECDCLMCEFCNRHTLSEDAEFYGECRRNDGEGYCCGTFIPFG